MCVSGNIKLVVIKCGEFYSSSEVKYFGVVHHVTLLWGLGRGGSSSSRETQTSLTYFGHFLQLFLGGTMRRSLASRKTWALQRGLLPVGCARNTSPGRHPNQLLEPPHLAPLDAEEQRLYSEPLTLSLRESPDALRRKPILAACIRDLVLLVTTHNS